MNFISSIISSLATANVLFCINKRNEETEFAGYKPPPKPKPNNEFFKKFEKLKERNREKLIKLGVNPDKVRFIQLPCVIYDFVDDVVSPETEILLPTLSDGRFDNSKEPIYINDKRKDRCGITVVPVKNVNWEILAQQINNSIKGFVFYLEEDGVSFSGETRHFEVDTEIVCYLDLDKLNINEILAWR